MSIKPILFSTSMVVAILEGRKTMTRRIVSEKIVDQWLEYDEWQLSVAPAGSTLATPKSFFTSRARCNVGCTIWVRETTYLFGRWAKNGKTKTGKQKYKFVWNQEYPVLYAADEKPDKICKGHEEVGYYKRPSIFMPKSAARIWLKVTGVRVERVQTITDQDAIAEGMPDGDDYPVDPVYCQRCRGEGSIGTFHPVTLGFMEIDCPECETAKMRFKNLWDHLNAKRGYGWASNPWVWIYSFERCDKKQEG